MAGVKNWLYDILNPDPQKMAETRALIDRSTDSRARALDSQVESVLGSYEPSQPREPAPAFNLDATYAAPVVGSGVRAPRAANPVMDELDNSPAYQQFKRQQALAPVGPAAPVAPAAMEDPAPIAPAAEARAPIRMFTSPARDVSAGPTPDVPTYTNVGTKGDVVDLSAQQNVGGPEDNGIDSEAYRRYRRTLYGDPQFAAEQAGIAQSGAQEARSRLLTENPLAVEEQAYQRDLGKEAAKARFRMAGDESAAAAKYAPYDAAIDGLGVGDIPAEDENSAHVKQLMSVKNGDQTPAGPMTPELRTQLGQQILERFKKQQKLKMRKLGTARPPSTTEQEFGLATPGA